MGGKGLARNFIYKLFNFFASPLGPTGAAAEYCFRCLDKFNNFGETLDDVKLSGKLIFLLTKSQSEFGMARKCQLHIVSVLFIHSIHI